MTPSFGATFKTLRARLRPLLAGLVVLALAACEEAVEPNGEPNRAPTFGAAQVKQQWYRLGEAVNVVLPAARGGDGALRYELTPKVAGLRLERASRRLTGTPQAFGYHQMTYTVHDADDDTRASDRARLQFTIVVGGKEMVDGKECAACPEMVVVPAGSFLMGTPAPAPEDEPSATPEEHPQHRVTIAQPFAVGVYELTFAEWDACLTAGGGCENPGDSGWGRDTRPVINVSWDDVQTYLTWLSEHTGQTYRLLSESEWEYAARAGTTTEYHFGDEIRTDQANYGGHDGRPDDDPPIDRTVAVGHFDAPNAFGLHDVHGNVGEWTQDCWHGTGAGGTYEGAPDDGTPWLEDDAGACNVRMFRGGSWNYAPGLGRSASRLHSDREHRRNFIGFRVARTLGS